MSWDRYCNSNNIRKRNIYNQNNIIDKNIIYKNMNNIDIINTNFLGDNIIETDIKHIAIIIPSRQRPHKIKELHDLWFKTTNSSIVTDCIIVLDMDDEKNYPSLPNFKYIIAPPSNVKGANHPLNYAAKMLYDQYEYIGFIGDDHRPRTKDWNIIMYNKLKESGTFSMVYANDLLQGNKLTTQVIMDSLYIKHMGYMSPPQFRHLYIDNFWMKIGKALNNIHYLENVIIEHLHYTNKKTPIDSLYKEINSNKNTEYDKYEFNKLIASQDFKDLVNKLLEIKQSI
jgi:hypothetical protein